MPGDLHSGSGIYYQRYRRCTGNLSMDTVDLAVEAGIATITFTNPPKGFLTSAMLMALADLLDQVEQDESVRVVIFTGGLPDVFIRHFAVEEILGISRVLQEQQAKGLPAPGGLGAHRQLPQADHRGDQWFLRWRWLRAGPVL